MKRFGSTYIFAGLVAALAGYAYFFEYKKGAEDEKKKEESAKLFSLQQESVQALEVESKGQSIRLVKAKGGSSTVPEAVQWRMEKPLSDYADIYAVNSLLSMLSTEKSEETIAEGAEADFATFGLNNPLGKIRFFQEDSGQLKSGTLIVSSESALGGRRYAAREGESKVLLVGYGPESQVNKTPEDFRSKKLFHGVVNDIERVTVSSQKEGGKTILKLEKDKDQWFLREPIKLSAENGQVTSFLNQIEGLSGTAIVSNSADPKTSTGREELKKRLLATPALRLDLTTKGASNLTLEFGAARDGKTYAKTSDRAAILEFPSTATDALLKGPDDFRDRRGPFRFDASRVSQIRVHSALTTIEVKKDTKGWQLATPVEGQQLDAEQVETLLTRLQELEVVHFLGTDKNLKLVPTKGEVVLKDSEGKLVFSVAWTESSQSQMKRKNQASLTGNLMLAKSSQSEEWLQVDSAKLASLPMQTLLVVPTPGNAQSTENKK